MTVVSSGGRKNPANQNRQFLSQIRLTRWQTPYVLPSFEQDLRPKTPWRRIQIKLGHSTVDFPRTLSTNLTCLFRVEVFSWKQGAQDLAPVNALLAWKISRQMWHTCRRSFLCKKKLHPWGHGQIEDFLLAYLGSYRDTRQCNSHTKIALDG